MLSARTRSRQVTVLRSARKPFVERRIAAENGERGHVQSRCEVEHAGITSDVLRAALQQSRELGHAQTSERLQARPAYRRRNFPQPRAFALVPAAGRNNFQLRTFPQQPAGQCDPMS